MAMAHPALPASRPRRRTGGATPAPATILLMATATRKMGTPGRGRRAGAAARLRACSQPPRSPGPADCLVWHRPVHSCFTFRVWSC